MTDDPALRRDLMGKGLFVVVGVAYSRFGPPLFDLEPAFVGSALAAYGLISFIGKRVIARWGILER